MRFLVALGGAAHSELAVKLAGLMAQGEGASITLLTIVDNTDAHPQAELFLRSVSERLLGKTKNVEFRIRQGDPAAEIVQECLTGNYDLLVIGERTSHRLLTRLRGSTGEKVIAEVSCPVLVAKGQIRTIEKILLCDSRLDHNEALPKLTARLAETLTGDTSVTILHVMSQIIAAPGIPSSQLRAAAEDLIEAQTPEGELLEEDLNVLDRESVDPQVKVRHGLVVDEILDEVSHGEYDLVVIGAHRQEGWQRFLLDDIAKQIMSGVDRPVLIVK